MMVFSSECIAQCVGMKLVRRKLVTRSPNFIAEGHAVHLENPASAQFPAVTLPKDDTRSSILVRTNGRGIIDAMH